MSEGSFVILTPVSQKKNTNLIENFLNESGVEDIDIQMLDNKYIEFSSDTIIEFPPTEFVQLCQSLIEGGDWYRVFENDEYGTEGFWYVDKHTKWRICTDQAEPNASTLKAYRKWHHGLSLASYGAIDEVELKVLEEKYGLFDKDGNGIIEPSPSLKSQVGLSSEFIGKNILVPHCGPYWNWYIPDHECLAINIAKTSSFPPDNDKINFRRTYIIQGDIGYVWSWESKGVEIFLLFMFFGESAYCQRFVTNYGNVTIDEVILIAYFDSELDYGFEEGFDKPCEWLSAPKSNDFSHQPIQNIDDGPFDVGDWVNLFEGRVMSPYCVVLIRQDGKYYLAKYLGEMEGRLEIMDLELDQKLKKYASGIYHNFDQGVYCKPKIRMKNNKKIMEFMGGKFVEYDDEDVELILAEIPLET